MVKDEAKVAYPLVKELDVFKLDHIMSVSTTALSALRRVCQTAVSINGTSDVAIRSSGV